MTRLLYQSLCENLDSEWLSPTQEDLKIVKMCLGAQSIVPFIHSFIHVLNCLLIDLFIHS